MGSSVVLYWQSFVNNKLPAHDQYDEDDVEVVALGDDSKNVDCDVGGNMERNINRIPIMMMSVLMRRMLVMMVMMMMLLLMREMLIL